MKRVIVSMFLMTSLLLGGSLYNKKLFKSFYNSISHASNEQWIVAEKLFYACKKYNFSYTCVAIGLVESQWGTYLINDRTGDYGVTGINIIWYFRDHNLKYSYWKAQRLKTQLVKNDNFAIAETLNKLRYWSKRYNNDFKEIWAHYNGGTKGNYKYASKIYNAILAFKTYIKRHSLYMRFDLNRYGDY
jgi:hypothetical protein